MKKSIIECIKNHRVAILLALVTAMLCATPQLYFRIDHKELYTQDTTVVEMLVSSNWSPRVREVQDGHPNWGSIYFKDGKDNPYLFQPLGSIIVAYTGMLFGLDINDTILLSRIVFPFGAFLLMYSFVFLITRNKLSALVSTSAILFVDSLLSPSGVKSFLTGNLYESMSSINFLELSHPVNSVMIFIFFFGFLVSFFHYYQKPNWQYGILSSVLLGLNFYNYFYSWTFLYAFLATLGIVLLFQREWQRIRTVAYVGIGGLVVAIPYILNLYAATQHPTYLELSMRHGVLVSHAPQFIGMIALGAIIIFLLGFPRENRTRYLFSLSLLLTPIVVLNQQILTGKVLQVGHYHWYMHKPIAIIFLVAVFFYVMSKWKWSVQYSKIIATSIILVSIMIGIKIQQVSYINTNLGMGRDGVGITLERQKYTPVIDWLNAHTVKESVVFANELTSNVIVIYTPLNVFHHHADQLTLPATDERLVDIIFTYYRLRGVDEKSVEKVFNEEKTFLSSRLFGIHYREKEGDEGRLPDEVMEDLIYRYRESLDTPIQEWLMNVWSTYEVEYLVWDTEADPTWQLDTYSFLKNVATFEHIKIYHFEL